MSITSSGTRKAGPYSGNGTTTAFPFAFKVFQASDLLVVQTDTTPTDTTLTLTTHYTVTLNANQDSNPGGTVNMVIAPPTGYLLTIGSQVPQLQSVTLTNNGGFYPTVINNALDYLTVLIQQLSEKLGRSLTMPFSTSASGQLPPVSPGSLLGWKQDGTGIANVGATGVGAGGIVASNMAAGATGTALSGDTQAAATKTAPADVDKIPLFDSASFWSLKSLSWANLKAAFKTYYSTLVGTQVQVSADASPLWWGTQSTLASGAAYALNSNILIMDAQCHNTQIDTNGNFTGVSETGIATCMLWGEDDVLRVFTAPSVTLGTVPTFGATPTYILDMKTGIVTAPNLQQQQSVFASVASNALTVGLNQTALQFRNATLGNGAPAMVNAAAALSLVVPSGATLGSVNATLARLILLAINNAGTMELAIVNQAGGANLDETTLINTTAISAAATANNVIYSANARTGVPFRVVGYIEATETTAGAWVTAPSLVQGVGGMAGAALQSLGMGQTWQSVTGSRAINTTYYNTTGRPIIVMVEGSSTSAAGFTLMVNSVVAYTTGAAAGSGTATITVVPPGGSYSWAVSGGTPTLSQWSELR